MKAEITYPGLVLLIVAFTACIQPQVVPSISYTPAAPVATNRARVAIVEPAMDSRFISGETVTLKVATSGSLAPSFTEYRWHSSIDGHLGSGSNLSTFKLSPGTHLINLNAGQEKQSVSIRVFKDLWEFYRSIPCQAEINRLNSDFKINFQDGSATDEKWGTYASAFDQKSADPNRMAAWAKLDVLRHQAFSKRLPYFKDVSPYVQLKSYVRVLNLRLDCAVSTAGGESVNLNRVFSVWDSRQSGSPGMPDACKTPLIQPISLDSYLNSLYLLLHEARHCEPGDPGHVTCKGNSNMDQSLDKGSGHARAAIYLAWVYKYGLYDPPAQKEEARLLARGILQNRICNLATDNPEIKALVLEIMGN